MKAFYTLIALAFILSSCKKDKTDPVPVASFDGISEAYLTQPVQFASKCSGANSINWDFGDGTTASGSNITHSFTTSGSFNVKITAANDAGQDVYSQSIKINNGKAEYNVCNKSTIGSLAFYSYYWDGTDILDFVDNGTLADGQESSYTLTNRVNVWLAVKYSSIMFISVYPTKIIDFEKNHICLYDTTTVYSGKKSNTYMISDLIK
jgi:hypothetical protein